MDQDKRRRFFFAEQAAGMYEDTIELVVPEYSLMHQSVLRKMRDEFGQRASTISTTILDVGSGTGTDSLAYLKAFPGARVVSVDLCEPIQAVHRDRLLVMERTELALVERSTLVAGDILDERTNPVALKRFCESGGEGPGFDAITTSLTAHHFEHDEKREFYSLVFSALKPGGVFINADLFSFHDERLTNAALAHDVEWISTQFESPSPEFVAAARIPFARRLSLRDRWLRHYRDHNRCEPIESAGIDKGQAEMLEHAGFEAVAVVYRFSLSGVLFARRPLAV